MSDTNMNNGIIKVYASQDWVKEQIDPLVANITQSYVADTGFVYSCDKTFAELLAAYEAGREIKFTLNEQLGHYAEYYFRGDIVYISFQMGRTLYHLYLGSDGAITQLVAADTITNDLIKQETGTAPKAVMSQKATTDAINAVSALVGDTSVSDQIATAIAQPQSDLDAAEARITQNEKDIASLSSSLNQLVAVTSEEVNTLFT